MASLSTDNDYKESERDLNKILLLCVISLVILSSLVVLYIEYYDLKGAWKPFQAALINFITSLIGFAVAVSVLSRMNRRASKSDIRDEIERANDDLYERIQAVTLRHQSSLERISQSIALVSQPQQRVMLLRDVPYDELFKGATHVGLMVHSWERWAEDRRTHLKALASQGGNFTLVLHNPNNKSLCSISSSRWSKRVIDQKLQSINTITSIVSAFPNAIIVKRDQPIWYCCIRFDYKNSQDSVYIISPYSNSDYPTLNVPCFVVYKSHMPLICEFFENDWHNLAGIES